MRVSDLLERTCSVGGSDLHLAAGLVPRIRVHGELEPVAGWPVAPRRRPARLLREIVSAEQWADFEQRGDLDFAYALSQDRFRANYFEQEQGIAAVFRLIPENIATLEELSCRPPSSGSPTSAGPGAGHRPDRLGQVDHARGIIDRINETYDKHIVTIEDPVEFVHTSSAASSRSARWAPTPRASPPRCAPRCARTPT